jgi:hypothetical protein
VTEPKKVLLWGLPSDPPISAVRDALQQMGCDVVMLDQHAVHETEVELVVGSKMEASLHFGSEIFDLAEVTALYLRPHDSRGLPTVANSGEGSDLWHHALRIQDALLSWADLTPALVLNRPSDMAANNSKPFQSSWIKSLGFESPDTLITTDPEAALDFWKQHQRVIYKSISGVRSIVSRLTEEHMRRFDNIASCPTQFQEYISGTEYRVHVVGEEIFACKIISDSDDYRYSTERVDIHSCDLPSEVAARCRTLAKSMHLPIAGLDLRRTLEGHWYCFEVNPSPGFTWFEATTRQPVAMAVARLLALGSNYS